MRWCCGGAEFGLVVQRRRARFGCVDGGVCRVHTDQSERRARVSAAAIAVATRHCKRGEPDADADADADADRLPTTEGDTGCTDNNTTAQHNTTATHHTSDIEHAAASRQALGLSTCIAAWKEGERETVVRPQHNTICEDKQKKTHFIISGRRGSKPHGGVKETAERCDVKAEGRGHHSILSLKPKEKKLPENARTHTRTHIKNTELFAANQDSETRAEFN
jgi:hypothetical protein